MSNPLVDELSALYLRWRDAVERRSAAAELRATGDERITLENFLECLGRCTPQERLFWEARRVLLDARDDSRCDCGHPRAHHDRDGSCFHVIGCATGCACAGNDHGS